MSTPIKTVLLLLVEDNLGDARLLREMLEENVLHPTELTHVETLAAAELHLAGARKPDIMLIDLGLPDAHGMDAVRRAHAAAPRVPLVVLTGSDDEILATRALQEGAQDYLVKGQIEPRQLMRALRYAIERKRLEQMKDEFVSSVSHELRTPLTSISGSLGLLMGRAAGELPAAVGELIGIAHTNCQRLVRLVNDILDIEKMEFGQVQFHFSRVDVRSLVEQSIEANRGFAEGYGVGILLEDGIGNDIVSADPDRLAQVVTNLLSNAIKFSPPGLQVVVAIHQHDGKVRISVRDHGAGISDDFKLRIFDRFAQADATDTREKGGTGLGLSIVKTVVERLCGEVGFNDAPGGGTIFYIDLPALIEPDTQPHEGSPAHASEERPHI